MPKVTPPGQKMSIQNQAMGSPLQKKRVKDTLDRIQGTESLSREFMANLTNHRSCSGKDEQQLRWRPSPSVLPSVLSFQADFALLWLGERLGQHGMWSMPSLGTCNVQGLPGMWLWGTGSRFIQSWSTPSWTVEAEKLRTTFPRILGSLRSRWGIDFTNQMHLCRT